MPGATEESYSLFLPPLDHCLNGGTRILSWKKTFAILVRSELEERRNYLEPFLSEKESLDTLSRCLDSPTTSTALTKSDFETRTAAINVTPTNSSHFDISQIKDDAIWLSQKAKVDEVAALRTVLIEWQERPSAYIIAGYPEEEIISLQQATGNRSVNFGSSIPATKFQRLYASQSPAAQPIAFKSVHDRRARIWGVLQSEQENILAVSVFLEACYYLKKPLVSDSGDRKSNACPPWLWDLGAKVSESQLHQKSPNLSKSAKEPVLKAVEAIRRYIKSLEDGDAISESVDLPPGSEAEVLRTQTCKIIRAMQLALIFVCASPQNCSAAATSAWFKLMEEQGFFQLFYSPDASQETLGEPLQLLSALISLQILQLPKALRNLNLDTTARNPYSPAVLDTSCQTQVTNTLLGAAYNSAKVSSLAMLAWSLILRQLNFIARPQRSGSVASDDVSVRESSPVLSRSQHDDLPKLIVDASENLQSLQTEVDSDQDMIQFLAHVALNELHALDTVVDAALGMQAGFGLLFDESIDLYTRRCLLELISCSCSISTYGPDILEATLTVLEGSNDVKFREVNAKLADWFLEDVEFLVPSLLQQAQMRYPYESEPFLRLCQSLSCTTVLTDEQYPAVTQALMNTPRFTLELPRRISDREFVGEDDSPNRVELFEDLSVLQVSKSKRRKVDARSQDFSSLVRVPESQQEFLIPSRTKGYIVSDPGSVVIMWDLQHSALAYLGAWLSTALAHSRGAGIASGHPPDTRLQAQIIRVISAQLRRTDHNRDGEQVASEIFDQVLTEAGAFLSPEQDVIAVVSDIFEESLGQQSQFLEESAADLLASCVEFLRIILSILPSRVWPLVARSQLLDIKGRGGQIGSIVASTELITGRYDFLVSCVGLFRALISDIARNSVARIVPSTALTSRFSEQTPTVSGLSPKLTSTVILAFTRVVLDVLRSIQDWKFVKVQQRFQINSDGLEIFERILSYVYAFDDTQDLASKLTGAFVPAAKFLVECFHTSSGTDFNLDPVLNIITSMFERSSAPFTKHIHHHISQEVRQALSFLTKLIRVGAHLNATPTKLHQKTYSSMPSLVRLYISDETLKTPVMTLLTALVADAARINVDPPSLLGHLNPEVAHNWLTVLSDLDRPTNEPQLETGLWEFMASVVTYRQKWLATYLLTGYTPRNSLTKKPEDGATTDRQNAPLDVALDSVSALESLGTPFAVALLKFVANAQNEWPWTNTTLKNHPNFLNSLTQNLDEPFSMAASSTSSEEETRLAHQTNAVSTVLEIFAMYVHYMRQLGDTSFLETLASRLGFLQPAGDGGVGDPAYDVSLHAHLKSNFEKRLPRCTPANFKKVIRRSEFGPNYFYDMDFSNEMLSSQSCWKGQKRRGGFFVEFVRANSNLSLVESQIMFMGSWKLLAIELSRDIPSRQELQSGLGNVALKCLEANAQSDLENDFFNGLAMLRADMALSILQKLVSAKSDTVYLKKVLQEGAWPAILACGQDFDTAFEGPNTPYYRMLLQILFLALQPHAYLPPETLSSEQVKASAPQVNGATSTSSPADRGGFANAARITETLLEITNLIIAKGVTSLTSQLHERPLQVQPSDFALLNSLLSSVLSAHGAAARHTQLALALVQSPAIRNALSLFSWSDRLTLPSLSPTCASDASDDDDPIYAELTLMFLTEASAVPHIAQYLAAEGILTRLDSAAIMSAFRHPPSNPGTAGSNIGGPAELHGLSPAAHARLDRTWRLALLPLLLNLLVAVDEPRFAAEVAYFLNGFSARLRRPSAALSADADAQGVTLAAVSEAHSTALVAAALARHRVRAGGAEGGVPELKGWDGAGLREDLEGWVGGRREALRERIVPSSGREVEMARRVVGGGGGETELEVAVVREMEGCLAVLVESGGGGSGFAAGGDDGFGGGVEEGEDARRSVRMSV